MVRLTRGPDATGLDAEMRGLKDRLDGMTLPEPAQAAPPPVNTDNSAGKEVRFAREDHTHAARIQRSIVALAANGTATWTFPRQMENMPSLSVLVFEPDPAAPVIVQATRWIMDEGKYAGVAIQGYRLRPLPTLANVSGLLSAVVTGINALVSALSGFRSYHAGQLAGVQVHVSAGEQM